MVEPSIARFIIPLGATINMDGTALYQVTAAVFLTQVFGVHLDIWGLIGLAATAVGASIGTPSTPGVGIVVLATILQGIGVPPSGIALIIGVDRILDMSRTTITTALWLERGNSGARPLQALGFPPDSKKEVVRERFE
jgi:Na+/H+-dicarboxylate symporter